MFPLPLVSMAEFVALILSENHRLEETNISAEGLRHVGLYPGEGQLEFQLFLLPTDDLIPLKSWLE